VVTQDFVVFAFVGFLAQMVDGALGMAYGVVSASVLLAFGVPPAHASASVHAAEIFTTAASGASHVWHRNIEARKDAGPFRSSLLPTATAASAWAPFGGLLVPGSPESISGRPGVHSNEFGPSAEQDPQFLNVPDSSLFWLYGLLNLQDLPFKLQ
jgi:hypothetical protein